MAMHGGLGLPSISDTLKGMGIPTSAAEFKEKVTAAVDANPNLAAAKSVATAIPTLTTTMTDLPATVAAAVVPQVQAQIASANATKASAGESSGPPNSNAEGGGIRHEGRVEVVRLNTRIKDQLYVHYDNGEPTYFTYVGNKMTIIPISKILKERHLRKKRSTRGKPSKKKAKTRRR